MGWMKESLKKPAQKVLIALLLSSLSLGAPSIAAEEEHPRKGTPSKEYKGLSGKLDNGVRVVSVEAFKYGFDPDPIVVGLGEKVRLELKSRDVTHGLGIKEYGIDEVVPMGRKATVSFTADKPGTFDIHCTVFCGPAHGDMHGTLIVKKTE